MNNNDFDNIARAREDLIMSSETEEVQEQGVIIAESMNIPDEFNDRVEEQESEAEEEDAVLY